MHSFGKLNAIVMAGDGAHSHPVFGKNKAFLEINGVPVVARVVSALERSLHVSEIYVVGPKEKLSHALSQNSSEIQLTKPVHLLEQHSNLYENVWYTFLETLPSYRRGDSVEAVAASEDADTIVLVVAADMPLLTPAEVDEFICKCDMNESDYVVGLTEKADLQAYYPHGPKQGIHLAYFYFREGSYRQNNMHMVRPFRVVNRTYVQTMYDLRYQKEVGNIVRLGWEVLTKESGGWGALGNYLLLQASLLSVRLRLYFLRDFIRRRTPIGSVIGNISRLMKTRFSVACTTLGGAALDIDNEHDYETVVQRFSEWITYQEEKARNLSILINPR